MCKKIPDELNSIIDYLTNIFSRSINSPVYTKEDLSQDLVIVYLENKNKGQDTIKNKQEFKNFWFRIFKNYLISKYRSVIIEKKLLEKIEKEKILSKNPKTANTLLNI